MNTRIKALSIFLFIIYISFVGYSFYTLLNVYIEAFKIGYETRVKELETGIKSDINKNDFELHIISAKSKKGMLSFPEKRINELNNEKINSAATGFVISGIEKKTIYRTISLILFIPFVVILIYLPILFFKMVRGISKHSILNKKSISQTKALAVLFILTSLFSGTFAIINFLPLYNTLELEGYYIYPSHQGELWFLIIGLILLLIAEILKVSLRLKEEQELTI